MIRRPGPQRVVILGGGFGGVHAALHLERLARARSAEIQISLVNRDNYLVFQPMLAEVVAGDVGLLDTVTPIRQLLAGTHLFVREIEDIDLQRRVVQLGAGLTPQTRELPFDHLVIALGSVTSFHGSPGLPEHALPFKSLADSVRIRNHVINVLEQASETEDAELRRAMLTFVIAGGGFSGTEVAAAINDFVRSAVADYRSIPPAEIRVVLVHSGQRLLDRELTHHLAGYATSTLAGNGVEVMLGSRLAAASGQSAVLSDGSRIATHTLISTVPSAPNPLLERLGRKLVQGRLECQQTLAVSGAPAGIWALGDCAAVPLPGGELAPPTAQHAIRQAKVLAENILADGEGGAQRPFTFTGLGKLGALGHHRAVAELPGGIAVSGLLAWIMWRGIYWAKLPGAGRRARVLLSWLSDLALPGHPVQLNLGAARGAFQAHYEHGETIFAEGDAGDSLMMILAGEVEVRKLVAGQERPIGKLAVGEYFGEMALLGRRPRSATTIASGPVDLLVLPGSDFAALADSLSEFRGEFERIADARAAADQAREAADS